MFLKAQDHVARGVFVHNIKDIQLTVEDEERSIKILTSKKLETENLDNQKIGGLIE